MPSYNNAGMIVIETAPPYQITDFDEGICQILGFSYAEFEGTKHSLKELMRKEDFEKASESISFELELSNHISLRLPLIDRRDNIITVLCYGQAFFTSDGRVVLQCTLTDISHLETAASETVKARTDLERFANSVPSGVSKHLLDNNLSVIWANRAFYKLSGYTEAEFEEAFHRNTFKIIYRPDLAMVIDALADLSEEHDSDVNFRIVCKDKKIKWVNAILAHSEERQEGFPVINLVLTDITSLKEAEMRASLEQQKFEILSDITEELAFEYDLRENIITFAEKFSQIFNLDPIMQNPFDSLVKAGIVPEESYEPLRRLFQSAVEGKEYYSTEFLLNTSSGKQWYMSTFSSIRDEDGNPIRVIGLIRNINKQKIEQKNLLHRAESDLMTGLLNKSTTEGRIRDRLRSSNGTSNDAMLLVDIDDFKKINDTYGHLMGDEVILTVADSFRELIDKRHITGRTGGDEFTAYLKDIPNQAYAEDMAKKIRTYVTEHFEGQDDSPSPTLSIGISLTSSGISYADLAEQTDTALYHTKLKGKNGYSVYTPDMQRQEYVNERAGADTAAGMEKNLSFIDELVNLLYMRQNTYQTLEKAIQLIGSQYPIDRICIWDYPHSQDSGFLQCSHIWNRDTGVRTDQLKKTAPAIFFEEIAGLSTNGSFYVKDLSVSGISKADSIAANQNVKSLLQSNIIYGSKPIGYITFASLNDTDYWSEEEIIQFNIIFKLLSETICSNYMSITLNTVREDTIRSFDAMDNGIIILNADTHEILYFNPAIKELIPSITINSACHFIIQQEHDPCFECPIKQLTEGRTRVRISKTIPSTGIELEFVATPFAWNLDINAILLSATVTARRRQEDFYRKETDYGKE